MTEFAQQYPQKDYTKKTFNMVKKEAYQATTLDILIQQGKMAELMIRNVLNEAMKRCGITPSQDIGIEYDLSEGSFSCYVPRNLCTHCKIRKAVHFVEKNGEKVGICSVCEGILKSQ